ncbi:MAG: LacI family DNA-binding transcriptional regulator [Eubacteriales bacterium]|nr:LacI family DNA-binding transcriptional regulator [Eubacteriales bacterium]
MLTIKDVAKHAGVSVSTVSRVINNVENVSPEIQQKVQFSIKELGYIPNNAARSLVQRQTNAITVLLRNLHSSYFSELIRGMEEAAFSSGRNVLFYSLGKDPAYRDQSIQFLTNGVSDAIILYGPLYTDQPVIEHLYSINFPFLLIENNFQSPKTNQFLVKNYEGAYSAIEYLFSKKHRRIAYFMGNPNKKVYLDRFNGYTTAMADIGLVIHDGYLSTIYDSKQAYEAAQKIMRQPKETRPTAIFCCNDQVAAYAIMGITDMGYQVPKDISVLGFDNQKLPLDNYTGPRITCVRQPLYEMGRDSIFAINDILDGVAKLPLVRSYDTNLAEYGTVCEPEE